MIRSPSVNAIINDLIARLRKNPLLPQEIGNKYLLSTNNQVTVYDFSRNSTKDSSNQFRRSFPTDSSTGSDSSGYHISHNTQSNDSNQLQSEIIESAYQQHLKICSNIDPFQPTDVDYLHSNQIFLPPTFNITHQSLEVILRQGAILSFYQCQLTLFAQEITEILPQLDIILSTPSIAASTITSLLPPENASSTSQQSQYHNQQQYLNHGYQETKPSFPGNDINNTTNIPSFSSLPISLTPLLYQAHIILTYSTLKSHIFYYFEQIGFCRDKFICHLRHDSIRTELYELISHDFRKLEEFVIKLKDFYSFCHNAALVNNSELINTINSHQQLQKTSTTAACLQNSLQSLHLNDSTNQILSESSFLAQPAQFKPIILFPPIYASKDNNAPLFYNLEIAEPTSSKFYQELGVLLELRYELVEDSPNSLQVQGSKDKTKPSGRYQIIIKNVGNYSIRVSQALFTLLDSSCFQPCINHKKCLSSNKSPGSHSTTTTTSASSSSSNDSDSSPQSQHLRRHHVPPPPPPRKPKRHTTSFNTPPSQLTPTTTAPQHTSNIYDDNDANVDGTNSDNEQGDILDMNTKHPLLRNDWLDLVHVNKPLTPLPQRRQNLLASQRVTNLADIQPSFICFSFDPPNNYRPRPTNNANFTRDGSDFDDNNNIDNDETDEIVLPHPYSFHHKNYPLKLLKLQNRHHQSQQSHSQDSMNDFFDEKDDDVGLSSHNKLKPRPQPRQQQHSQGMRKQSHHQSRQRYLSCSFLIEILNPNV